MKLVMNTNTYIDSLNGVLIPLKQLPMFGLDTEQFKKVHFHFTFNTLENENDVGSTPRVKYCDCDRMKPENATSS